jgi:hypothetical protein
VFDTYIEEDASERRFLLHIVKILENIMADYTKLTADVAELKTLVTDLLAKQNPPPVDEQPAVDAVDAQVNGIIALIKPPAAETPAA